MPTIGVGPYTYEPAQTWHQMPEGDYAFIDVPAICVDSKDNVYAMNRGNHPIQVYDKDGKFVRSWGEGQFDRRAHGIHASPDDHIWTVNDSQHCVKKYTTDGQLKLVIGTEGQAAQKWSGVPFNRPTNVAISPTSGDVYITDGYGNSHVHRFTAEGKHIVSWGGTGCEPGEFQIPHNVVIDRDENVFVTDRENNRLQVFDRNGKLQDIWHDIYRPQALCMDRQGILYIGEMLNHPDVGDAPGVGHRLNAFSHDGKRLARIGDPEIGDDPTQFIAPHGFGVDSQGNLFVGEVSFTVYGQRFEPKRVYKAFRKLIRK